MTYLLYDTDYILLCNDTFCQQKNRSAGVQLPLKAKTIKVVNTKAGAFLMFLRNDAKSLILFSLNDINSPRITQVLEIN